MTEFVPVADNLADLLESLSTLHDMSDWQIMPELSLAEDGTLFISVIRNYGERAVGLGYVDRAFTDMDAIAEQFAGARAWYRARTKH